MTRYLATLYKTAEPASPAPPELLEAIMKLGEEATQAGALLDTAGLAPSVAGARVELAAGNVTVTDGPFTESKELIAGYAMMQVNSMQEAIAWGERFAAVDRGRGEPAGLTEVHRALTGAGPGGVGRSRRDGALLESRPFTRPFTSPLTRRSECTSDQ